METKIKTKIVFTLSQSTGVSTRCKGHSQRLLMKSVILLGNTRAFLDICMALSFDIGCTYGCTYGYTSIHQMEQTHLLANTAAALHLYGSVANPLGKKAAGKP